MGQFGESISKLLSVRPDGLPYRLSGVADGNRQANGIEDIFGILFFVVRTLFFSAAVRVLCAVPAHNRGLRYRQRNREPFREDIHGDIDRRAHLGLAAARSRQLGDCLRYSRGCVHRDLLFPVRAAARPEED